jgi:hypothetical protein
MTPAPKQKRKIGGQAGNKNALKHGIYSRFVLHLEEADLKELECMGENIANEMFLARSCLTRSMHEMEKASTAKEKLSWDYSCHYWFESIRNLQIQILERKQTVTEVWSTFVDAVRAANDRQGVKR